MLADATQHREHAASSPNQPRMNVVIAEDEGITRLWLEELLELMGYTVSSFGDGKRALDHLHTCEGSRIVLLDWQLPGVTGIEICRQVKSAPDQYPPCHLIILSGESDPTRIAVARAAGADDYVIKPFDPDDVERRIRKGIAALAAAGHS